MAARRGLGDMLTGHRLQGLGFRETLKFQFKLKIPEEVRLPEVIGPGLLAIISQF